MTERAFFFGPARGLFGVATLPPKEMSHPDRPAVILVTAGRIHRVGPNRLYVRIARTLAQAGFRTLRFDLSGIGDSPPRSDTVPVDERAIVETTDAMDHVATSAGVGRFVLIGLCSGADDALLTALSDTRVTGVVMIDPCLYSSLGYLLHSYSRRVLSRRSWGRLLSGKSDALSAITARITGRGGPPAEAFKEIPGSEFRAGLQRLALRGARLMLVYSPNSSAYFNYRRHVQHRLPADASRAVHVACVPGADHTFTGVNTQAELARVVEGWMRQFAAPSGRVEAQPEAT